METEKLLIRAKNLYAKNQIEKIDPKSVTDEIGMKIVEKGYLQNKKDEFICLKCKSNLRTEESNLEKWKLCPFCKSKF